MIETILHARRPEDVFGVLADDAQQAERDAKKIFREFVREIHPDRNSDPRAEEAFKALTRLHEKAVQAIQRGIYGQNKTVVDEVLIRTRRRAYKITDLAFEGDSSNIYSCTYDDNLGDQIHEGLIKIARSPRDNDLLSNEAQTLKKLLSDKNTFDLASPYLPSYIETFGYRTGKSRPRQATAFSKMEGLYTLEDVRRAYPHGIHAKDMAWMFRRLLMALGFSANQGIVHGAVLPQHVLIHPELHGLVLIDWKAAVEDGHKLKVAVPRYRDFYPREVFEKKPAYIGTDIYMAVRCMEYVIGDMPQSRQLRAFFRGCSHANPRRRPQEPFALKDEFDELLERMWGPRRFRPFAMKAPV